MTKTSTRVSKEDVRRVKADVDLGALVRAHGVELEVRGDELVGLCPFHKEKTPSFSVHLRKGVYHCFGCGAGGDAIEFLRRTRLVNFSRAVELLRSYGSKLPAVTTTAEVGTAPLATGPVTEQDAYDLATAYYHEEFKRTAAAQEYAAERVINTPEIVSRFKLGFANRTLGMHLPASTTADGLVLRQIFQGIGILRQSGHEFFRGCLTVPITDENGHTVWMYGRRTLRNLNVDTPRHLYLPGQRRGVFNVLGVRGQETVFLCESIIDALTFYAAGFQNVTCAYGVDGFTDEIFETLKVHGTRRVYIAFDRDEAGERGAAKVAERLMASDIECFRVQFPRAGLDANEYGQKMKPLDRAFAVLVNAAVWLGKGTRVVAAPPIPTAMPATSIHQPSPDAAETPSQKPTPRPTPPPEPKTARTPLQVVVPEESVPVLPAGLDPRADEVTVVCEGRSYRVRGIQANTSPTLMRVNVHVRSGAAFYVDTVDLNLFKARAHFQRQAAVELGVTEDRIKADVGEILNTLEAMRAVRISEAKSPKDAAPELTDEQRKAAMELLLDKRLLDRILGDFERCGIVGEETNKLTAYLAAVSRKLKRPLAVVVQSTSAAGKSALMEAVLAFMPAEETERYSAMTERALYYMGQTNLRHKILALAEEEGAERASYALKLLQSEGRLSIASTGKDPTTGMLETKNYVVEGPVMIFQTTTAVEMDEELLNRCLVLTVDESREQTRRIHNMQRDSETLDGLAREAERERLLELHQNAQRLLEPLAVYNPYAQQLTFPDEKTRLRRDFPKYLALIRSVTLLHQHQRSRAKMTTPAGHILNCVVTSLEDIEVANKLARQVLGRTLDELPPQTRRLLGMIFTLASSWAKEHDAKPTDLRLSRRDIREHTGWGNTQLKVHLQRLVEMEYVLVHRGIGQQFVYEVAYDGSADTGTPFLAGLTDVSELEQKSNRDNRSGVEGQRSGLKVEWSGPGRVPVGGWSGAGRGGLNGDSSHLDALKSDSPVEVASVE
jgi:DNA primase